MKWEYKILQIRSTEKGLTLRQTAEVFENGELIAEFRTPYKNHLHRLPIEFSELFNSLGEEGWELISSGDNDYKSYISKRQKA